MDLKETFAESRHIHLEDSYILAISIDPGVVEMKLYFVLLHDHPEYADPLPREWACYRRGWLRFMAPESVNWLMPRGVPARDATGELDWGGVDQFEGSSNCHLLVGSFGELSIVGASLEVVLDVVGPYVFEKGAGTPPGFRMGPDKGPG